ncbi:MAG: P-loop containing nucleoside triphosphate hydrolase protein [Benniella sp.]|nr:MAG: P-loop containing nucleoside triphosphate hydrolase protein [Benniella sp.]
MASGLDQAIITLIYMVALSFIASLTVICLRALVDRIWSGTLLVMYNLLSFVAVAANTLLMHIEVHKGDGHWSWDNYGFWWLLLVGDSFIGWFRLEGIRPGASSLDSKKYDLALVGIFLIRYALLWIMALLLNGDNSADTNHPIMGSSRDAEIQKDLQRKQEERANAFQDFWPKIKRLIPFVYPKDDIWLQFLIFVTFVFLILGRVVNLLIPIQTNRIVSRLSTDSSFDVWGILFYAFLRYLQNLIIGLRGWTWIPIEQYSNSTLTIRFFEHVHNLSLEFHLHRKTGELLRILDRGTNSITSMLSTVLFQLFPVGADVIISVVYFCVAWDWRYSLIVLFTIVAYVAVTIMTTEWRTMYRCAMISSDNDARAKAVDSLLNYETVKYYSAEEFEIERYSEAIRKYTIDDYKSQFTNHLLAVLQSFVLRAGMLVGCLLCAYEISIGKRDPAHFVEYIIYLNQHYTPVTRFGHSYRTLHQIFIDMEKMIALFEQDQVVKDAPGAGHLVIQGGEVVFENVSFQYDIRQRGLRNISFTVPKGKTVALVGPSGSGKSTILRLLFRFYDVTSGRILIDGQDISQKTQASLRKQIGVVPQDAVLFNDSIYYNICYSRPSATEEEVRMAAKAAQIHDKIMDFPDLYNTRVGERALRLSGGERQRVAIARTILKNPPIVLLDEATSALDSITESQIQVALTQMTEDRTTLVVAHRLSTIVNADLILCIVDGVIVEQGTHSELIERALAKGGEGVYYGMWKQQNKEDQGDDSTVGAVESDDSKTRKKRKGKESKAPCTATTQSL